MENQQQQQTTTLCRGGCGFFGASATEGLCSKCYKDHVSRKQDEARMSPPLPSLPSLPSLTPSSSSVDASEKSNGGQLSCSQEALSSEDVAAALESAVAAGGALLSSSSSASLELAPTEPAPSLPADPPVKKANRCQQCKKRVGLTGFSCRCGGLFCSEHRYDTAHSCSFDYKTMEREELRKNNPVIVSDKIQRI